MKIKQYIIFLLLIFVNNQVPSGKAVNSCGSKYNYEEPTENDCIEPDEVCCYVEMVKKISETVTVTKRFCASAPSIISKSDIEDEIKDYTGYKLEVFKCNNSKYMKGLGILFLFFMFLF